MKDKTNRTIFARLQQSKCFISTSFFSASPSRSFFSRSSFFSFNSISIANRNRFWANWKRNSISTDSLFCRTTSTIRRRRRRRNVSIRWRRKSPSIIPSKVDRNRRSFIRQRETFFTFSSSVELFQLFVNAKTTKKSLFWNCRKRFYFAA